eukprot:scpid92796/ scgid26935/ Transmembrane protein C7orf23
MLLTKALGMFALTGCGVALCVHACMRNVCVCARMVVLPCATTQIIWYREGDLDPKFRRFIYFNAFTTILLCIAGNLFFHLPFAGDCDPCTCPTQPPTAPPTT